MAVMATRIAKAYTHGGDHLGMYNPLHHQTLLQFEREEGNAHGDVMSHNIY